MNNARSHACSADTQLGFRRIGAGLWAAARAGLALRPDGAACAPVDDAEDASVDTPPPGSRWARPSSLPAPPVTAASLLRKLRWAAVGPPFDWTRRSYPMPQGGVSVDGGTPSTAPSPAFRALPVPVAAAARRLASALGGCPEFRGDAALVNYYGVGDTLGGHVDDAERAQDKPIVAFSLGCPGIFLLVRYYVRI
jgi:alkylated DNA repair protein alkB family protein 1